MIYHIMEFALFLLVLFFIVPGIAISSTKLMRNFARQSRRHAVHNKELTEKPAGW